MDKDDDKPKVVSITTKTEKLEEDYNKAVKDTLLNTLADLAEQITAGHIEHMIIIKQCDDGMKPQMIASGDSSEDQLYKMYHYLATQATDDYDYGMSCIKGEFDD